MTKLVKFNPEVKENEGFPEVKGNEGFPDLIAVSSDGLYVINNERNKIVDVIVAGNNKMATLLKADDENSFLDGILLFQRELFLGRNPLHLLEL